MAPKRSPKASTVARAETQFDNLREDVKITSVPVPSVYRNGTLENEGPNSSSGMIMSYLEKQWKVI